MVQWKASEAAEAAGGRLVGPDVVLDGASGDSRSLQPGQLFVPLVAERDGHDFIGAAQDAGAAAYLTAREPAGGTAICVRDTGEALRLLGCRSRELFNGPVVGITGSVGKTSVKDLAAAAIAAGCRVHASPASFNNEIGVPLTLLNRPSQAEVLVLELGARGRGHIAELCALAEPTVGVVTTVGVAHTERFGTVEEVAAAKGELVEALAPSGTAVLNADDQRVLAMRRRTPAQVLTYGTEAGDVRALAVTLDEELRPRFRLQTPQGNAEVALQARGTHMVSNALAAVAAALCVGVGLADVCAGLASAALSPWRMEMTRLASGALLINDSYNANPMSMSAALRSLAAVGRPRRVAVLGLMAELGDMADAEHAAVGALCEELGIEVISVGVEAYGGLLVDDVPGALAALGSPGSDTAVLVKASRAVGLEAVAEALTAGLGDIGSR